MWEKQLNRGKKKSKQKKQRRRRSLSTGQASLVCTHGDQCPDDGCNPVAVKSTRLVPSLASCSSHQLPLAESSCCLHPCAPWSPCGVTCHQERHPSPPEGVQPLPECQYNILGICSTRLSPCRAHLTAPRASHTWRSCTAAAPLWWSTKALPQAGTAFPSSYTWPAGMPVFTSWNSSTRLLTAMSGSQPARRQGPAHSSPSPLPLPICSSVNSGPHWTSRPVSPEVLSCSSLFTSTGWNQLLPSHLQAHNCQRIILSVSLFYLSCFVLSQPTDSWLWIQAGSNTQLKSHILLIKCFTCFPSLLWAASEQRNEDRAASGTSKVLSLQFHACTSEWAEIQPSSSLTNFSATCSSILLARII